MEHTNHWLPVSCNFFQIWFVVVLFCGFFFCSENIIVQFQPAQYGQSAKKKKKKISLRKLVIGDSTPSRLRAQAYPTSQCQCRLNTVPRKGNKHSLIWRMPLWPTAAPPPQTGFSTWPVSTAEPAPDSWIGLGPKELYINAVWKFPFATCSKLQKSNTFVSTRRSNKKDKKLMYSFNSEYNLEMLWRVIVYIRTIQRRLCCSACACRQLGSHLSQKMHLDNMHWRVFKCTCARARAHTHISLSHVNVLIGIYTFFLLINFSSCPPGSTSKRNRNLCWKVFVCFYFQYLKYSSYRKERDIYLGNRGYRETQYLYWKANRLTSSHIQTCTFAGASPTTPCHLLSSTKVP